MQGWHTLIIAKNGHDSWQIDQPSLHYATVWLSQLP